MMAGNTLQLHDQDNVVVALSALGLGASIDKARNISTQSSIPKGHKVALSAIEKGMPIRKYNQVIGFATTAISAGAHVHVHNCEMGELELDYSIGSNATPVSMVPAAERRTFMGFLRDNGKVGTRNYIGLIASVNCSATVVRFIANHFNHSNLLDAYPNIDGVVAIHHGSGCGMANKGDGFDNLQRALVGYSQHPNFAAVLLVGLGCEVMQLGELKATDPQAVIQKMTIQAQGGTSKTIAAGIDRIGKMLAQANAIQRQPVPVAELTLALQCGGSDSYSGITANPALGRAADLLIAQGGTAILSETPEIFGAEHLLTARAADPATAKKIIKRIQWWRDYTARNGGNMNNNPSPGNIAGGLTTILEKSLGAVAKGGSTPLQDFYLYAEPITKQGFVFMDSPGFDPCSVTGQVASGANIVCFTTGRGSAFGFKPVPSIKLATNSEMYYFQEEDMDINCGDIIDEQVTIDQKAQQIFEYIIKTASGEQSKSEALGYGDSEFVPWQIGAVM